MRTLKLATRGSKLALAQAELVKHELEALGARVELVTVSTKGDRNQKDPLTLIGGRGLFVREVEQALLDGRADLAVHSGKDLPYELAEGLVVAGVPKAAAPEDVLVCRKELTGAQPVRIGTGSPRRRQECRAFYPNAEFSDLRGNVDTRLQKLRDEQYDAIVLARAGLERLGVWEQVCSEFSVRTFFPEEFVPAPCQGILAVECRKDDAELVALLEQISDAPSRRRFEAERALFSALQADCTVPVGVHCTLTEAGYRLTALYYERKVSAEGTDLSLLSETIKKELLI